MICKETGRSFKKLRVSLTPVCNMGCSYCTSGVMENTEFSSVPVEDTVGAISRLHKLLDLETVRFTGGEPLLSKDLPYLISEVNKLGISDIHITTNASLLERKAEDLSRKGLKGVNISMDAQNPELFEEMTSSAYYERVIRGITSAISHGLKVKLNAVIMKGKNQSQILPLLKFASEKNVTVRFLELMNMGPLYKKFDELLYTGPQILETIKEEREIEAEPRKPGSTARYWTTDRGERFGIIANHTDSFCHDCNRLRLDSKGNIFGCISSTVGLNILEASEEQIKDKLELALSQKKKVFSGSPYSMKYLGG